MEPITSNDIICEIKRLKHNKSPGHDLIGSKVIKLCPEIFATNLSKIYNWGIENGKYPDDLKIAKVIALYKKGVKYDPNNYRPISLLSHFDKIFEKILCRRLVSFLERNKILYCYQYGFRKSYSTVLALIEITDHIKRLYWHDHVDQICASLVKYFGIFNHIKNFVSLRISKQLYYAFIYSRIQYGIEAYGSCAKESLSKLQIMQNKLLKLLLKWDRRTPTDLVHQRLSILKIDDVHIAKVLSFVNECRSCRVPEMFVNYYKTRETGLNLRNRSSLDIPWARTDLGLSRCDIKGARLWNNHLQTTSQLLYKKSFHKQISKFLTRKYN